VARLCKGSTIWASYLNCVHRHRVLKQFLRFVKVFKSFFRCRGVTLALTHGPCLIEDINKRNLRNIVVFIFPRKLLTRLKSSGLCTYSHGWTCSSEFCPHCVRIYVSAESHSNVTFSLYNINWSVFVMEAHHLVCEVRTEPSYTMYVNFSLQNHRAMDLAVSRLRHHRNPGSILFSQMVDKVALGQGFLRVHWLSRHHTTNASYSFLS
jgi:hypothetical protein